MVLRRVLILWLQVLIKLMLEILVLAVFMPWVLGPIVYVYRDLQKY